MADNTSPDAISVFISGDPTNHVTEAHLMWPIEQPTDIYTVDVKDVLSIGFDTDFPVRPSVIHWLHNDRIGTETIIEELFGSEFTKAMITAKGAGAASMQLTLSEENRAALAKIQYDSPSTPDLLREACAKKLGELGAKEDTGEESAA